MFRHYVDPNGHFYLTPICCYGSQKRQIVRRRHEPIRKLLCGRAAQPIRRSCRHTARQVVPDATEKTRLLVSRNDAKAQLLKRIETAADDAEPT
jgi:hypothetical protein